MKAQSKPTNLRKSAPACPCGHASGYAECCARYHAGAPAPSAEALMRSRYSAYALGLADYLLQTWAAETRPAPLDLKTAPQPKWLGLEVRHAEEDGDTAVVEFIARCKINGRAERLHEHSRFVRRRVGNEWHWYYLDGDFPGDG
ncbi:MAG TPA: YchJ family metal-binding protein [Rhodocyclaceae bacterium]